MSRAINHLSRALPRTPGPWNVGPVLSRRIDGYETNVCAISAHGEAIAAVFAGHREEANAAYIVRACNAHDELVAALERLTSAAENRSNNPHDFAVRLYDSAKAARAVLAKVSQVTP